MAEDGDLIVRKEKHAERLVDNVADAQFRVIPFQGHLLHHAVPERRVTIVDGAMKRAG